MLQLLKDPGEGEGGSRQLDGVKGCRSVPQTQFNVGDPSRETSFHTRSNTP